MIYLLLDDSILQKIIVVLKLTDKGFLGIIPDLFHRRKLCSQCTRGGHQSVCSMAYT